MSHVERFAHGSQRVLMLIELVGTIAATNPVSDSYENYVTTTVFGVAIAAFIEGDQQQSIFLKFQGGKSAATALGTLLALQLFGGLSTFALWIFLVWSTRIVSIASIGAGFASPFLMALFHAQLSYVIYTAIGALYVVVRHRANMQRLLAGTEPKIGQKV